MVIQMSESELAAPLGGSPTSQDEELVHQTEHMRREHLLLDPRQLSDMSADVLRPVLHTGRRFWLLVIVFGGFFVTAAVTWIIQMTYGIGITGLNRPVEWAPYITNFVYFVGIGHAGTFISAAFRVLKIEMRRPISRIAEAVTVFALGTAALFPIVHLGRSWRFYWLVPYPNQRELWPSFHSPLAWDLMAILTYLTGSIIFMYVGLLPDLAMARDHTTGWRHRLYSILSLSWRGTEREWARHEMAMNIFSYVIIPVMFSVHTIVSWDFAMALQPGWHSTIFGPYFVVGALFSGVGAVTIVMAIVRKAFHLEYFLRREHFDGMAKLLLVLSFAWAYFFFADYITQWYGGQPLDKALQALWGGPAAPLFVLMLFSNVLVPAATLWSRRIRRSIPALLIVCVFVQIGMYIERALIVAVTLGLNELPSNWGVYYVRLPEVLMTLGAFALAALLYTLFSKVFPLIPAWEVREGQMLRGLRRIGRAIVPTRSEMD
jgi:Ni/Fe-hydrogenase subunit HybB-like protein